ncbi:MAG: chromosome segregation protein SMC [Anaerolineae bacterium]|nr:chromosome segregation protein SMC [Anaerolineae bacterium]
MRLSRLIVQGYKSFATRTEFSFPGDITAIVGPNGSGKSNIADALRWVLGEQSYSQLRSRRTSDLIFAGSDGRSRLGMAEATMVLDNSDGSLPLDFQEVSISRRAYRSGENEYYLNGVRTRLKDLTELLAQGGLDRLTFSVIGQGMVDAALSLSPAERRRLFEEAAGITAYQSKRETALRQLDEVAANVLRVRDLMGELEPQLRRLATQAEQTNRWREVQAELAQLQTVYFGQRLHAAAEQAQAARERALYLRQRLELQSAELAQLQHTIEVLAREERELSTRLASQQLKAEQLNANLTASDREAAVLAERERALKERLAEMGRDRRLLLQEMRSAGEEERSLTLEAERLHQDAEALRESVDRLKAAQAAERERRRALQGRLEQVRRQLSDALSQRTEAGSDEAAAARRSQELTRLMEETSVAVDQDAEVRAAWAEEVNRLEGAAKRAGQALAQARRELDDRRQDLRRVQQQLAQTQRQASALEEEEQALRARLSLLTRMQRESYYPGVREVLELARRTEDSGIVGVVASLIRVPTGLEVAIEAALGARLQQVVVRRWSDAERAIEHLKRKHGGRVTFLPLETIQPPAAVQPTQFPGLVGVASNLVEVEPGLERVGQYLLNRILVVEDLTAARLALERVRGTESRSAPPRSYTIATLAGEVAQSSGSVTGGGERRSRSALLEQERERRRLPAEIRRRQSEREGVAAQALELRRALEEAEAGLSAAEERVQQARAAAEQAQGDESRAQLELRRVEERLQWQGERLAELKREQTVLARRREIAAERVTAAEAEAQRWQEVARQLEAELAAGGYGGVSAGETTGAEGEAGLEVERVRLAALQERVGQIRSALEGAERQRARLSARLEERNKHLRGLREELAAVRSSRAAMLEARTRYAQGLQDLEQAIRPERERLACLQRQREDLEGEERIRRQQHLEFGQLCGEAEISARRAQDVLTSLREAARLELEEESLRTLTESPAGGGSDNGLSLEEMEARVEALRRRRRAMGNVNPNAPQEHAELQERYQFLASQAADLEQAASSLRQVIQELEQTMQRRFRLTFEQVAARFEAFFRELFGGGSARLSLSDPEDLSGAGVDITVRPPGKRSQDLALLSGGERALTSVALLFALLEASGTPFCVMDEVDAMLDEANVSRFRRLLQRLATDTQFIVISHNRHTIEAADAIYGVTMGEDGTSHTLSLMLNEASQVRTAG